MQSVTRGAGAAFSPCKRVSFSASNTQAKLRQVVAEGPVLAPKDKKWGPPLARSAQRKEGPYELYGELPEGFDAAKASALVDERAQCKASKDYARADELREQCLTMGVKIRDDYRTWFFVRKE